MAIVFLFPFTAFSQGVILNDNKATRKTKALYQNLHEIAQNGFLFGHQDTDAYGTIWKGEADRSDVKDVAGSHAAVHGWDLGNETGAYNLDSVSFKDMQRLIKEVYRRGGINTISWHMDNPVTGESSWNKEPVVADIIPGGRHHGAYVQRLDIVAKFIKGCKRGFTRIPLIFRPWHEHNGDWFWWGKGNCSEEDYKKLYRFTVEYLRDKKNLHNIIYAFSPDRSRLNIDSARTSYMYGYPGDGYVDLLGLDNYMDVGVKWNTRPPAQQRAEFVKGLTTLSEIAKEKKKVAALTETGLEGVTNPTWFTDVILEPITSSPSIKIAYVLVWRNASNKHHYAPYRGHAAEQNFMTFYNDPATYFENDLVDIYK